MKLLWSIALFALTAWCLADAGGGPAQKDKIIEKEIPTKDGGKAVLRYIETVEGKGKVVEKGNRVLMHYTGWLKKDGKKFDSSMDHGKPLPVTLGAGNVIKGWDEGVPGMKEGGKRKLLIPPELAYGAKGVKNSEGVIVIPPDAELVFEVEVVSIIPPED
jgi:FKBP-type peptidyl-prolyl cis-trans isomerase FkpA